MGFLRSSAVEWTPISSVDDAVDDLERGVFGADEGETEMMPLLHSSSSSPTGTLENHVSINGERRSIADPRIQNSSSLDSDLDSTLLAIGPKKIEVQVLGMTCAACSNSVENALLKLDGVLSASVSLLQNKAIIEYDPVQIKASHHPNHCFSFFFMF